MLRIVSKLMIEVEQKSWHDLEKVLGLLVRQESGHDL